MPTRRDTPTRHFVSRALVVITLARQLAPEEVLRVLRFGPPWGTRRVGEGAVNQRVLVVGAQGALGHAVVELAAQRGHAVRALARRPRADFFPPQVELLQGDVADTGRLIEALADCSALLFCVNVPITTTSMEFSPGRRCGVTSRSQGAQPM